MGKDRKVELADIILVDRRATLLPVKTNKEEREAARIGNLQCPGDYVHEIATPIIVSTTLIFLTACAPIAEWT